jgi:hypothetical protein
VTHFTSPESQLSWKKEKHYLRASGLRTFSSGDELNYPGTERARSTALARYDESPSFHSEWFHGDILHSFLAFIIVAAIASRTPGSRRQAGSAAPAPTGRQDFGALAPAFVPNAGEADRTARFLSVGGGRPVFFTHDGVRIVDARHQRSLWLTFADADAARIEGESPTGGLVTFLHGRKNFDSLAGADVRVISRRRIPARLAGDRRAHHRV